MLRLVERLLGSTASGEDTAPRELTEIETALVSRVFTTVLEHLSVTWAELADVTMELRAIESQLANVNLAPPSEPTLMLTMEVRFDKTSSTMALVIPHRSVESVLADGCPPASTATPSSSPARDRGDARRPRGRQRRDPRRGRVDRAHRSTRCSRSQPGQVLRFGVPAANGVRLFAGQRAGAPRPARPQRQLPGRPGHRQAGGGGMTTEDALIQLAESTGAAIEQVLEIVSSAKIERSHVAVVPSGESPLRSIPVPAVAANVSYVHGVTGGNIFVMTRLGVRRLAAAMMGMDAMEVTDSEELSELDLSAAGEAMNQMMAAAAGATATVLGEEVEISPPETRFFATPAEAADAYELTPHVTTVGFTLLGEPCRLVQLVPNAFVVRMKGAFDEIAAEAAATDRERPEPGERISSDAVRSVPVRVWAELGPHAHAGRPRGRPGDGRRGRARPRTRRSRSTSSSTAACSAPAGCCWSRTSGRCGSRPCCPAQPPSLNPMNHTKEEPTDGTRADC